MIPFHAKVGVGIDIGTTSAKVAVVETSQTGPVLRHIGLTSYPTGTIVDGRVSDVPELRKAIAQELPAWLRTADRCTFSVPSEKAQIQWINLPEMPENDFEAAAAIRAKRLFGERPESAVVCNSAPIPGLQGEGLDSLLISLPDDILTSRANALAGTRFPPTGAELEAQALLRLLDRALMRRSSLLRDGSWTLVDLGMRRTQMLVVQAQRLQFHRGVRFGGARFESIICDHFEIDSAAAASVLQSRTTKLSEEGILTTERGLVDLSAPLDVLIKEFTRLLRYFRSLHPERSYGGILDNVMLCGGLSGLNGLAETLGARLGLHVEVLHPFAGMRLDLSAESYLNVIRRQEFFAVAAGLALSGLDENPQEVTHASEFAWQRSA